MPDIQTILSGLSEAQKRAILAIENEGHFDITCAPRWVDSAVQRLSEGWGGRTWGVFKGFGCNAYGWTPLGRAVRAALQGEQP